MFDSIINFLTRGWYEKHESYRLLNSKRLNDMYYQLINFKTDNSWNLGNSKKDELPLLLPATVKRPTNKLFLPIVNMKHFFDKILGNLLNSFIKTWFQRMEKKLARLKHKSETNETAKQKYYLWSELYKMIRLENERCMKKEKEELGYKNK